MKRLALALLVTTLLCPAVGAACTVTPSASLHPTGETLPVNSALVLTGRSLDVDLEATMDGVPIELAIDHLLSGPTHLPGEYPIQADRVALRPTERLAEGASLRVFGRACHGPEDGCVIDHTYTLVAPDVIVPAPWPLEFTLDYYEGGRERPGDLCDYEFFPTGTSQWRLVQPQDRPDDEIVFMYVRDQWIDESWEPGPAYASQSFASWEAGGVVLSANAWRVCVEMYVYDLAGNHLAPQTSCRPSACAVHGGDLDPAQLCEEVGADDYEWAERDDHGCGVDDEGEDWPEEDTPEEDAPDGPGEVPENEPDTPCSDTEEDGPANERPEADSGCSVSPIGVAPWPLLMLGLLGIRRRTTRRAG